MSATTMQMAPNKPIKGTIQYVNVWPNDLTKNNGKGYGASLNLKGTFDGQKDGSIYPKGFLNKNLTTLIEAGVIEEGFYPHDPEERYSIPVVNGDVTLLLEQNPGEKYPTFKVISDATPAKTNGAPKPQSAVSRLAAQTNYKDGPLPGEEAEYADAIAANGSVDKGSQIRALHAQCFKLVCDAYVPAAAKVGVELSLEGVSALTFQLFKAQADAR